MLRGLRARCNPRLPSARSARRKSARFAKDLPIIDDSIAHGRQIRHRQSPQPPLRFRRSGLSEACNLLAAPPSGVNQSFIWNLRLFRSNYFLLRRWLLCDEECGNGAAKAGKKQPPPLRDLASCRAKFGVLCGVHLTASRCLAFVYTTGLTSLHRRR